MKLIIDIPEVDYNYVKQQVSDGNTNPLKRFIGTGTPISEETYKDFMDWLSKNFCCKGGNETSGTDKRV